MNSPKKFSLAKILKSVQKKALKVIKVFKFSKKENKIHPGSTLFSSNFYSLALPAPASFPPCITKVPESSHHHPLALPLINADQPAQGRQSSLNYPLNPDSKNLIKKKKKSWPGNKIIDFSSLPCFNSYDDIDCPFNILRKGRRASDPPTPQPTSSNVASKINFFEGLAPRRRSPQWVMLTVHTNAAIPNTSVISETATSTESLSQLADFFHSSNDEESYMLKTLFNVKNHIQHFIDWDTLEISQLFIESDSSKTITIPSKLERARSMISNPRPTILSSLHFEKERPFHSSMPLLATTSISTEFNSINDLQYYGLFSSSLNLKQTEMDFIFPPFFVEPLSDNQSNQMAISVAS